MIMIFQYGSESPVHNRSIYAQDGTFLFPIWWKLHNHTALQSHNRIRSKVTDFLTNASLQNGFCNINNNCWIGICQTIGQHIQGETDVIFTDKFRTKDFLLGNTGSEKDYK